MPALPSPELFGDFLLLQRIAAGGMAEVLLAVRLGDRTGRTYVVKRPLLGERPSGRAAQAIAREGEVLSTVRGAGIVALEAAGEIAGLPYLAIEHVRGAALDAILDGAGQGAISGGALRAIARDLAAALAALHAAGWVHGDIAPSNILLDDAGELRLIDFGLATKAGAKHIEIAGKPGYIAPEAVRPVEAAAAEDIYGWAVVVAECALGRRLFKEESLAEAGARGEAPPEAAALESVVPGITAALRRDPSARPDAASIAERLKSLDLDRAALAELVARTLEGPDRTDTKERAAPIPPIAEPSRPSSTVGLESNALLTPTIPMAIETIAQRPPKAPSPVTLLSPAPLSGVATDGSVKAIAPAPPTAPGPDRWKRIAITLLVLLGLMAAGIAGRLSARRRDGAVSIAGNLPRRTQIELDGRPAPRIADAPSQLEPGKHTVVLSLPKGERREYPFTVRPGEHVILIPFGKNAAGTNDNDGRAP